ncbi:MAG: response regulator [Pseudomonadota bacterium]|nr:response regulator [Pseudomonadota bacterium]
MNEMRGLTALIVEPHTGMRASLHNMLNLCGLTRIEHAVSSGTAIRQLQTRSFDLILCEYDLGEGQDGQQLLEDLRHNKIIALSTVFFMVTAERAYEKVVGAAELAPTDYILKPFTADTLLERIGRAIERRTVFAPLHQLMARGELPEAIALCLAGEASNKRYAMDFKRLRAELHVLAGEPQLAEPIYREILAQRAVAWGRLGLAKTLFLQDQFAPAEALLTSLVAENAKFMDAYDWLARAHEANGKLPAAKSVLADAVAISPHAVRRLRRLGEVALESGDVATAEKAFAQVVTKARYSEFRDPEDHVRLVTTLVKKGDTTQAATIIRDLEKSLSGQPNTKACHAISSAMLFDHTGDDARAAEQLEKAVAACRDSVGLSTRLKIGLAGSCLAHQLDQGASEVMLEVMNNAPNSAAMAQAMQVFEAAGRKDLAELTAKESRRVVVELVSSGADKARNGDYRGAVSLMMEAVKKLPDNPQVVFNAAVAVLKYLENLGWDARLGDQARTLIDTARRLDPANPRLSSLSGLHQTILKKYQVGGAVTVKPA